MNKRQNLSEDDHPAPASRPTITFIFRSLRNTSRKVACSYSTGPDTGWRFHPSLTATLRPDTPRTSGNQSRLSQGLQRLGKIVIRYSVIFGEHLRRKGFIRRKVGQNDHTVKSPFHLVSQHHLQVAPGRNRTVVLPPGSLHCQDNPALSRPYMASRDPAGV